MDEAMDMTYREAQRQEMEIQEQLEETEQTVRNEYAIPQIRGLIHEAMVTNMPTNTPRRTEHVQRPIPVEYSPVQEMRASNEVRFMQLILKLMHQKLLLNADEMKALESCLKPDATFDELAYILENIIKGEF